MKRWMPILVAVLACGPAVGLRAVEVGLIKIKGAIGPATASYIARAVDLAGARNDACLIIQLDTPEACLSPRRRLCRSSMRRLADGGVCRPRRGLGRQRGCFITLAADVAAWPRAPASAPLIRCRLFQARKQGR